MSKVFGNQELYGQLFPVGETPRSAHEALGFISRGQIDLAVNGGTGSDTPTASRPGRLVSGDYQSEPFATIQAAIDALPPVCPDIVNIYVAAGNYAGFQARGVNAYSIAVRGTQAQVTPTTGSATGTATSGTAKSLTLTGATWTADDFQGKFVEITAGTGAGQWFIIATNTADTLHFAASMNPAPDATSVFRITEPTTVFTSGEPLYGAAFYHANSLGTVSIRDFEVNGPTFGFLHLYSNSSMSLTRCVTNGCYWSYAGQNTLSNSWSQIGALNSTGHPIQLVACLTGANSAFDSGWLIVNASGGSTNGLAVNSCLLFSVAGVYIKNCGNNGVYLVDQNSSLINGLMIDGCADGLWMVRARNRLYDAEIKNNTGCGVSLGDMSKLESSSGLIGSGNGTWGVKMEGGTNNRMGTSGAPTITGTTGDFTLDASATKTWSTDLASAGTYQERAGYGTRIVRI